MNKLVEKLCEKINDYEIEKDVCRYYISKNVDNFCLETKKLERYRENWSCITQQYITSNFEMKHNVKFEYTLAKPLLSIKIHTQEVGQKDEIVYEDKITLDEDDIKSLINSCNSVIKQRSEKHVNKFLELYNQYI